jgi:hypothetical protein
MNAEVSPGVHQFGLIFDEAAWPLLYVRFPSKPLSDEGMEYFIERYTVAVERKAAFATILDSRGLTSAMPAHQRKRLTEWFEVTGELASQVHFGIAVLIGSAVVRGALKAVTWVAPIPVPVKAFGSIADSESWIREICAERRIPITPAMELLLNGRS